jgi:hypothetical protein
MVKTCKIAVFLAAATLIVACSKSDPQSAGAAMCHLPLFVQQQGDKYLIKQGDLTMEVNPAVGGRISSLKHGKHEILITQDLTSSLLWGSILWSSPQSEWGWPPIDTLDHKPYRVSVEDNQLVLASEVDKKSGYQFVKSHRVSNTRNDAFVITYSIYNHSDEAKAVAPWELTRVPTSGIVLFPSGERNLESGIFYPMEIQKVGDISWFLYDDKKIRDDHHKMMTDSTEGWLAFTDRGYLLIKEFADVPTESIAPNEGEIELFTDAHKTYLELQQQGPVTMLQPGEHLDWEVVWHVKKLPPEISIAVGSEELVSYIRYVLGRQ